jgi:hypothetical protein
VPDRQKRVVALPAVEPDGALPQFKNLHFATG